MQTEDGRTLAWTCLGSGPPVVLHGGGPGGDPAYLRDFPRLDPPRTLIAFEARGTGESTRAESYELGAYAADLEALRAHLGIARLDVVGHSHGGFVVQTWAAAHPGHAGRLILAGSHARFALSSRDGPALIARHADEPWFEDAIAAHRERVAREAQLSDADLAALYGRAVPLLFATLGEREQALIGQLTSTFNGDALRWFNARIAPAFDLRALLPAISAATLAITGEFDPVAPPSASHELASLLPRGEAAIVPSAGHFAPWETHGREPFADAVSAFLLRGESDGADSYGDAQTA